MKSLKLKLDNRNLKININKTKCIIFGRNSNESDTIDLGVDTIKISNNNKYLGYILD